MRCSSCSAAVKPVVAIDIDGTLGDYHSHFIGFAEAYLQRHLLAQVAAGDAQPGEKVKIVMMSAYDYIGRQSFSEWFSYFGVELHEYRQIKLAYRQGGMKRSMPIFPGAFELCRDLREVDAEVWLTTTRPYLRLDGIDPDTRFWLEHHKIKYDGLLYDEDKYQVLADNIDGRRVIAVLDDQKDQIEEAVKAFGPSIPILRCTKWNATDRSTFMTDDLPTALQWIAGRMTKWEEVFHASV